MSTTKADKLPGKRALVTGGTRRLGLETVMALARQGVELAIHYHRSRQQARELCQKLEAEGTRAVAIHGDLDDPDTPANLLESAWKELGGLEIVVNNASIFPPGSVDQMELEDLFHNIRVNAWAPFAITRSFWRSVTAKGKQGSVVNLLDTRMLDRSSRYAAYHFSKVLLWEITSITAREFAPQLQVNAVAPGAVLPPVDQLDSHMERLCANLPLQRRGYPADVVDATLYLLQAPFVTGQTIFVDGGRHLGMGGTI